MKRHLQYWGALYVLALLFIVSIVAQYLFQVVFGNNDTNEFLSAVFENWQSEWIQLFMQALLIQGLGHVLYKKEAEDQERMEAKLDRLLQLEERSALMSQPAAVANTR
jgi:hypothetical protein